MKKHILTVAALLTITFAQAQFFNPTPPLPTTNIFRQGQTGFGTSAPPTLHMVEVEAGIPNDGISISQSIGGAALLKLINLAPGGNNWSLNAFDNTFTPSGAFTIGNITTGTSPFVIDPSTDKVGIGNTLPSQGRLDVLETNGNVAGYFYNNSSFSTGAMKIGARGTTFSSSSNTICGLYGSANIGSAFGFASGVIGEGTNGQFNFGGQFSAFGPAGSTNFGVFATVSGSSPSNYAGYFIGDVFRTGSDNFTSDRRLKDNIKPITNALDKLMLLKPSTYNFRTNEFKDMNLPAGEQMGLIAQELEQVFPELVTDMKALSIPQKDGSTLSMPEFKSVRYINLIPVLISAIQEQQAEIVALKNAQKQTGINDASNSASSVTMEQNEPNPFTGQTTIRYNLPQSVKAAYLAIFDLTGKQISTFALNERGSASISLSSENLSAGLYLYSIVADGQSVVDAKKMMVAGK